MWRQTQHLASFVTSVTTCLHPKQAVRVENSKNAGGLKTRIQI